jgi:hypothetical protein
VNFEWSIDPDLPQRNLLIVPIVIVSISYVYAQGLIFVLGFRLGFRIFFSLIVRMIAMIHD